MIMEDTNKYYYQILIELPHHRNVLLYLIKTNKLEYNTEEDLINYIKSHRPNIKKVTSIIVQKINQSIFENTEKFYNDHHDRKDYIVIRD